MAPSARRARRARRLLLLAVPLAAAGLALGCRRGGSGREATIGAAASLRHALPELIRLHEERRAGAKIRATYGASGDLQKQVEGGAPIDGVIFASARPVDALIARGLAEAGARRVIATNTLILIGPAGGKPVTIETLDTLPAGERIAVGDPGAVPAGQYAKETLQKLGLWDRLAGRLVLGGDVGAVLAYARRGEVAAAFVYRTEIRGVEGVVELDEAKGSAAPRVEVVATVIKGAPGADEARAFLDFLSSAEGQAALAGLGFGPP